ncbi:MULTISPECIES: sensor histidine kinase [Cytobacillus]|uniref:histidine kinase n=1 Tax=Cytobacillus oceanisediminis 2691 TaxID=1196031 RepID=A0A160MC38_9BACI|nr:MULTISPECIES: sensor histidine kinase [Cytobacillus]AND40452.1 two-component sensor histidine kinase [Cytobacillus oceanisediminis 2691]MBU8732253.1 sensor histidine kinase [Cytobacillus oceanisediminis]USK42116.1 sensor histidine kinase [Cytobacillus oceanisediminis]
MILALSVLITFLLVMNIIQYVSRKKINNHLHEISEKLAEIIEHKTAEKVLLQTDQHSIQFLLIQINRLLAYNQKVFADYASTKDSLRKMISNMSHDLKTPLTVILGYVEKLKLDDKLSEDEKEKAILRLHDKVVGLISLLNQFFDLVKIESNDYMIPLSKISLNEICRKNVLDYYDLLLSKGLQVEIDIPERNFYILGNEHALNRILSNLISNSIRYGSDGGVFGLTLREDKGSIAVEIWDKGKGIAEVHQDRVFDRLYTLDDARNPQFQGSGLGLSISKRLTEAMNGSIHLRSKPFEKTAFICIFKQMIY